MPIYTYRCGSCLESYDDPCEVQHRDEPRPCRLCIKGVATREFTPTTATIVPAWMSATRSGASEKQAAYLKSDKHRENKKQAERMQDRASNAQQNFEKFKRTLD